jgi:hypothetical protein
MTEFVQALMLSDHAGLAGRTTADVAFNSPIRRYADRRDVLHLLGLLGAVLPGARIERSWVGADGAATVIRAGDGDDRLDGVVEELHDADGRVREVTLLLRPHGPMMSAIKRMAGALEASPLPSSAGREPPAMPSGPVRRAPGS